MEERLELNTIYNQDCLIGMHHIADKSVDLVLTDPPYGINFNSNRSNDKSYRHKLKSVDGILNDEKDNNEFLSNVIDELFRVLKDDTHLYWFTRWDKVVEHKPMLKDAGFNVKNNIIWIKNNWSMGDLKGSYAGQYECILFCHKGRRELNKVNGKKRHADILQFDRVAGNGLLHSHQKPTGLLELLINKSSNEGDIVLDPFMGSGSTAVSCINTNRQYIGFEMDKDYWQVANERIDAG